MAKTDWNMNDTVQPQDMNDLGAEINAKETPDGSTAKAAAALAAANQYTDDEIESLAGEGRTDETVMGNAAALAAHKAETTQYETLTVGIPSDYETLQAAIDELSKRHTNQGTMIKLLIESGHALTHGVIVENGDYGYFRIESESGEVAVSSNFSGNLIYGNNARMPVLACVINMDGKGEDGYHAFGSSLGYVDSQCGVINAGARGLYVNGSSVHAWRGIFTGAGSVGIWATRSAMVMAGYADVSGSTTDGVEASRGATIYFNNGIAHDCGRHGIYAKRSRVVADGVSVKNSGDHGVACIRSGVINISDDDQAPVIENSGGYAIFASGSSFINAEGVEIYGSNSDAVRAVRGSNVCVDSATITGSQGRGLYCNASFVSAENIVIESASGEGIMAENGGKVCARGLSVTNSGTFGIRGNSGADITATNGEVIDSSQNDLSILRGCIVRLNDTKTTSSAGNAPDPSDSNVSFNEITERGLVFANSSN